MINRQTMNSQQMELYLLTGKKKTGNAGSEVLLWLIQIN